MKVIISLVLLAASAALLSWFYLVEEPAPSARPEISAAKMEIIKKRDQSAKKDQAQDAALAQDIEAIRARFSKSHPSN
ncbi:MAG: hypothetical protein J4F41_03310 [Alphaproteobacteria bacterium]|nr:hypothetical protein [Alphaproteobacteria bacterium]